jgi:AcrR family transcriptional regulator
MSPPVSARRAQTRDRLMDAALDVFAERGVLAASVEEVCERAGFTRGAFYSNFATKDELCVALLTRACELDYGAATSALEAVQRPVPPDGDPLEVAIGTFFAAHPRDPQRVLAQTELMLHAAREPGIRDAFLRLHEEASRTFATIVTDGVRYAGYELIAPVEQVVLLLGAAYERAALLSLIEGTADNEGTRALLTAVLRSAVRPRP